MSLVFIGHKGCGKTHFGRCLAQKMSKSFTDTDLLIEELYVIQYKEDLCCRDIALKIGEEGFRLLEKTVIFNLKKKKQILSVGGGALLDFENCSKLASLGKFIHLKMDKETVKKRWFKDAIPSFLNPNDLAGSFEIEYQRRNEIYIHLNSRCIEAVEVDIEGKSEDDILQTLYQLYQT